MERTHSKTQSGGRRKGGVPNFAHAQRDAILALLREAKLRGEGVDKAYLIFERHYSQCAARIWEIEKLGYQIRHETRPGQIYVTYFLEVESSPEKPLPTHHSRTPDWTGGQLALGLSFDETVRP